MSSAPQITAESIRFFVPGIPKPRGSKSAFSGILSKEKQAATGRQTFVRMADSCKSSGEWMEIVGVTARIALAAYRPFPIFPSRQAVHLNLEFHMPRPKGHFNHKGALKVTAPHLHVVKPDGLKLARGVEDALSGIAYPDDNQVVRHSIEKKYADIRPGVWISITFCGE